MMAVVGYNGADEAAHNQRAQQFAVVYAVTVVIRRRCGMMLLHNGTGMMITIYRSAFMHHGFCPVTRSAFVHHRLAAVH